MRTALRTAVVAVTAAATFSLAGALTGAYGADELDGQATRVLDVDSALTKLALLSPRAAQIAECRFFGGLSAEEAASALGLSRSTATREWRHARAWLHRYLAESDSKFSELADDGDPPERSNAD